MFDKLTLYLRAGKYYVGLQYICYTVAYPEQEGEEGKTDGNQTENLPLGGGAELQKKVVSFARFSLLFNCAKKQKERNSLWQV